MFKSFPVQNSTQLSESQLTEEECEITNDNSWSPDTSVNTDFLLSSIMDSEVNETNLDTIEQGKLNPGWYSKITEFVSWATFNWGASPSTKDFPKEKLLLAVPVLRQNWFFKCKF